MDGEEHSALPLETAKVFLVLVGPADVGDVLEVDGGRPVAGDRGVGHLRQAGVAAAGLDGEAAPGEFGRAAGKVDVGGVDGVGDAAKGELEPGDLVEVERDAHLLVRVGPFLDLADAGDGFKALAERLGEVLQPPVAGVGSDERQLH